MSVQRPQRKSAMTRIESAIRELTTRAQQTEKRGHAIVYSLRVLVQVIRQLGRDRCPQQAASLSFQTLLSVVPLIAVAFAFLRATGAFGAESTLVDFLSRTLIPVSREEVAEKLRSLSGNLTFESLGLLGLLVSVLLAFFIFNSLENVVGAIWRVERKRPLAHKFMVFYATATIGTFLMATSIYQAAKFELTSGWTGPLIGLASTFIAAFLVNFVLPTAPVRIGPAAAGAAFFSLVFEVAKLGFGAYVGDVAFSRYAGVYGALAIVPILLVWVYYSWLMLLLGAEIAYAIQNLHHLERLDRRGAMSLENELSRRVNGVVAARVMTAISHAYTSGQAILSRRGLSDRFDLSEAAVDRITTRLKDAKLVIEVDGDASGFLPARPPADITLADVLAAFRGDDVVLRRGAKTGTRLDQVLAEIESDTEARTRELYLPDLY